MKVSIITATFNSENEIIATYNSIKQQTMLSWEWLVTDDCSTDRTVLILKEIANEDSRVKIFCNDSNSGAAVARNNSISKASGDFIAFIDSDDLWLSNKLASQVEFMESNSINFSFTAYELIDTEGIALGKQVDLGNQARVNYTDMLKKKATIGCSTVVLRTEGFECIKMPLIRTGQDYAAWLNLLKIEESAYLYDVILTKYRIRPGSISRNKVKKAIRQWEIYRRIESLSLPYSLYCFIFYAFRALFKR